MHIQNVDKINCTDMFRLIKNHPEPEYDCSYDQYIDILKQVMKNPLFRAWIAYEEDKAIGYISALRSYVPRNQININDIYVENNQWGGPAASGLMMKIMEWVREDKALRVSWTSKISHAGWERFLRINKIGGILQSQVLLIWEDK